jgi:hypothetical protein
MLQTGASTMAPASGTAAQRRVSPRVFLLASTDSGAEAVLQALESTGRFCCAGDSYSFWEAIAGILRHHRAPPLPGIHQLASFSQLVVAARHLSENLTDSAGSLAEHSEPASLKPQVEYSPGNIRGYPVLRLLYPEAVYLHIIRNPVALITGGTPAFGAAVRRGRQWRSDQRLLLGSPPAAAKVQARFEDILADPATWVGSLGASCGIRLTDADIQRFAVALRSRAAAPGTPARGNGHGRRRLALAAGIVRRMLVWALAVCCDAELAVLGYADSIGRPGAWRRIAANAILSCCEVTCGKGQP